MNKEEQEAIKNLKLFLQKEENYMTNDKLEVILNLISKLQKENEKQSKVIDEMADLISCECEDNWIVELWNIADGNIKELVKQHFYRKVSE